MYCQIIIGLFISSPVYPGGAVKEVNYDSMAINV